MNRLQKIPPKQILLHFIIKCIQFKSDPDGIEETWRTNSTDHTYFAHKQISRHKILGMKIKDSEGDNCNYDTRKSLNFVLIL